MAYEPVTVTQYRAKDGSLHGSRKAAEGHDIWMAESARLDAVRAVVEEETWRGEFSEFCGYDQQDEWKRKSRNEDIARLIIAKWAELRALIEPNP